MIRRHCIEHIVSTIHSWVSRFSGLFTYPWCINKKRSICELHLLIHHLLLLRPYNDMLMNIRHYRACLYRVYKAFWKGAECFFIYSYFWLIFALNAWRRSSTLRLVFCQKNVLSMICYIYFFSDKLLFFCKWNDIVWVIYLYLLWCLKNILSVESRALVKQHLLVDYLRSIIVHIFHVILW